MKWGALGAIFLGGFSLAVSAASSETIEIQAGDTLSVLALTHREPGQRVYGNSGFLAQILALNPHIQDADRILPGTKIQLPTVVARTSVEPPEVQSTVQSTMRPTTEAVRAVANEKPAEAPADITVEAGVDFVYSKIDGTDIGTGAKAAFVSDLLTRYYVGVTTAITPSVFWKTQLSVRQNQYLAPDAASVMRNAPDTKRAEVSILKKWENGLSGKILGGVAQELFVRRSSPTEYVWDVASVPFLGLAAAYDVFTWRNHTVGFEASYSYLSQESAGAQKVETGSESAIGIFLKTEKESFSFQQHLGMSQVQQNSNIVEQSQTTLAVGLKLGYSF